MDPTKRSNNLHRFPRSKRKSEMNQLSSKDKKYYQQVERALASFDSLDEWADYITFLTKLQKSLQFTPNENELYYIPFPQDVSYKLSLCLSSTLPNGVHQKALSIYDFIFETLTADSLNDDIHIWLPGLLPLFSYSSISVKPLQIKIFKMAIAKLNQNSLRNISKPLTLSLLSGLDDENSEYFNDVLELLEIFKSLLNDDSQFWRTIFICIIGNPEKRIGALNWCTRRLPIFHGVRSKEAESCLHPDPGLLLRAFTVSINSKVNDIIIVRRYFDLLTNNFPLNILDDIKISARDKELLLMWCCKVTLNKDMSLNRRLWNYLLGPEIDHTHQSPLQQELENPTKPHLSRSEYFAKYALDALFAGMLNLLELNPVEAFKISTSLIMDRWEISNLVTPKLFSKFLVKCYQCRNNHELMVSATGFFDGIESSYIWNDIINIICSTEEDNSEIDMLGFILKEFNFNEEEMITQHAPLAIVCMLASFKKISHKRVEILQSLINLVPPRAYHDIKELSYSSIDVISKIKEFYKLRLENSPVEIPFTKEEVSFFVSDMLVDLYIEHITDINYSCRLADALYQIFTTIPNHQIPQKLVQRVMKFPVPNFTSNRDEQEEEQEALLVIFGVARLFSLSSSVPLNQEAKLFKIILSNIWTSISSSNPANHQVESIRVLYELETNSSFHEIEGGILELFLALPKLKRIVSLETLWTHSIAITDSDSLLQRPLEIVLDELDENDGELNLGVSEFLDKVIKNGGGNRLLKLLINPILSFGLLQGERKYLDIDDDLFQFSYYLKQLTKVIGFNNKTVREIFNNEFAVMDNNQKLLLIKGNDWNISTYKSLIMNVIEKFLSLELSATILNDKTVLHQYWNSVTHVLKIIRLLVTGNEPEFNQLFSRLIGNAAKFIEVRKCYTVEIIQSEFIGCIFHFLEISQDLRLHLNLFELEEDKESILVNFIASGIKHCETSVLLEKWISLLTKSIYLFGESIFQGLIDLNRALVNKLYSLFFQLSSLEPFSSSQDLNASISILIHGLEDLLSISHSYLLTSKIAELNSPPQGDNFLNTVISGVFQIESPATQTKEQNKLRSVLLAFQEASRVCYKIWYWADNKPKIPPGNKYYSKNSLIYVCHKLKFRARKLLETLMELERQEVIEVLIQLDSETLELEKHDNTKLGSLKLLNILDGGRSQVSLPHLFDAIIFRNASTLLDASQVNKLGLMNIHLSNRELVNFLIDFIDAIDNDTIIDIWSLTMNFLRTLIGNPVHFQSVLPSSLRIAQRLSIKSSKMKDSRNKKELGEVFLKLFNLIGSSKHGQEDSNRELNVGSNGSIADDIVDPIIEVIPSLEDILQDSDKISGSLSSLINNFISPQVKSKELSDVNERVLRLIECIGKQYPIKAWTSLVSDVFMDNRFFNLRGNQTTQWDQILSIWIDNDKDKLGDLIAKIASSKATSTASNLFIWSETTEIESKISVLKRISYLVLLQPVDYFLIHFDTLCDKLTASLHTGCPDLIRFEILTLFRVISLRFSEMHLVSMWTIIVHELLSVLSIVSDKSTKELAHLSNNTLLLILNACKLLDQLLIQSFDKFNLDEWLFVSANDEYYSMDTSNSGTKSIINEISRTHDFTYLKDTPIRIDRSLQEENRLACPLLYKTKQVDSITKLRLFFDSLSLIHYERTYGLYTIDMKSCVDDIINDLFE
ncbi:uncharacterized protein J8A68_003929 [[Candida] subhashii]|uniref:Dopey N-terminal domain-containing protein n=1 Tax=[Candida] subhashii TaxID=561895 RepID=A0A8J5UVX6_9ASCO|nr:uncharacterized protein J8A68_003929 [[Candida] subhashii]KAG7662555.1 hypothetical protein J8A68_003929 [[Candida] subhashii]